MKISKSISIFLFAVMILFAGQAFAQVQQKTKTKKATGYYRMYDTATVETLKGTVASVEKIVQTNRRGRNYGVHVMLNTGTESIPVHLGPSWFLDKQDVKIQKGDSIEVTGSRITYNDKPAIVAAVVTKESGTLKLRDDKGFPYWSGWRNRTK